MVRLLLMLSFLIHESCKSNNQELSYELPFFTDTIELAGKIINDTFIFETGNLAVSNSKVVYCGRTDVNDMNYHIFDYDEVTRFTVSPDNRFAFAFKYVDLVSYLCKFMLP